MVITTGANKYANGYFPPPPLFKKQGKKQHKGSIRKWVTEIAIGGCST